MGAPDDDSLEAKLRALAEELGETVERAIQNLDLEESAERLGLSGERVSDLIDLAGRWLARQTGGPQAGPTRHPSDPAPRRDGPHPLDMPTEEQGLALSALDSGRWKVDAGTEELVAIDSGPGPSQPIGLVGELRARDWIAPDGQLTLVGRDALKRWLTRPSAG
jgi:hypothetical protein